MSFNSFNLSTHKKDDMSLRLKQQNLRRAKEETRKLEHDGKKMEERLMELKLAMNREKEERERQGGGFWKSGQQGNLTTYADEVLAKKKSKSVSSGKGKIKILRDKPLDLPERSNQPGTMAYIAQKGSSTPRDKPKGPKCGQCEERGASVSCVQCAEDYCAGCFAAFHLKGNLKKHRSIPITATPRQCFASPRPSPSQPSISSSFDSQHGEEAVTLYYPGSARKKDRNSPEGASGSYETNNLLYGSYDEAEQAASFQEALQAWRAGKAAQGSGSEPSQRVESAPTPRGVAYSPVQTPTVNVDSSTGTPQRPQDIEIKFNTSSNTSSLSYAERLLLKKHRRTDVETLFTPRSAPGSAQPTPRMVRSVTPRYSARGPSRSSIQIEEFDEGDFDEERVDFQSLLQTVQSTHQLSSQLKDPDSVSIVEVESLVTANIEQTSTFKVQEVDGTETWSNEVGNGKQQKLEAKPPTSAKSRRRSARKSAKSSTEVSPNKPQVVQSEVAQPRMRLKKNRSDSFSNSDASEQNAVLLGSSLKEIEKSVKVKESETYTERPTSTAKSKVKVDSDMKVESDVKLPVDSRVKIEPLVDIEPANEAATSSVDIKQRPDSAKSRPKSSARLQSRQGTQSRAASSKGSRPVSRTSSRIGSSRASSRIEGPGVLTKGPSEALQAVARMTPTSDREYKGMDSFFMVGVHPAQEEERTLTPSQSKKDKEEKIKVSYQLYSMAPKSWKPDFSISDSIPVDNVDNDEAEDDRAASVLAYHAYSEQVMNEITDKLISRFGELPLDDDRSSDRSSGSAYRSLGEEYRTFTPTPHDSPLISGRGTPVHGLRSARRESAGTQNRGSSPKSSTNFVAPKPSQELPEERPQSVSSRSQRAKSARQSKSDSSMEEERVKKPRVNTPRAKTPRAQSSRAEIMTPRRSKTYHGEMERPVSRAIVMEGTDLSIFDDAGDKDMRNQDDEETLDQLEWELASQTGRITADGKISRMEMSDDSAEDTLNESIATLNNTLESLRSLSRLGQDQGYDINSKLRNDELEDEDVMTARLSEDEDDVRALH